MVEELHPMDMDCPIIFLRLIDFDSPGPRLIETLQFPSLSMV